jgi:hypothetical protein
VVVLICCVHLHVTSLEMLRAASTRTLSSPVRILGRQSVRCLSSEARIDTIEIVDAKIAAANAAQQQFLNFDQKQVDFIFQKVAHAAARARIPLAHATVNETKMGCFEDKVCFRLVPTQYLFLTHQQHHRSSRTR